MPTPNDARSAAPIFYVHVMKTGGTTLFRHLRENFPLDELYPYRELDIHYDGDRLDVRHHLSISYLTSLSPERRQHIKVYTGHFPYIAQELMGGRFVTASILRDPVQRTVSLLRQFRRKKPWAPGSSTKGLRFVESSLEEVYAHPTVFEPLVHNHQTKIFSMLASDAPESYMDVIDVDEARLEIAKDNLAKVDLLGVTERYDLFLDEVESRFDWHVQRDARANATPTDDNEPVSPELLRRIEADNALDMELHAYAAELVAQRAGHRTPG